MEISPKLKSPAENGRTPGCPKERLPFAGWCVQPEMLCPIRFRFVAGFFCSKKIVVFKFSSVQPPRKWGLHVCGFSRPRKWGLHVCGEALLNCSGCALSCGFSRRRVFPLRETWAFRAAHMFRGLSSCGKPFSPSFFGLNAIGVNNFQARNGPPQNVSATRKIHIAYGCFPRL